MMRIGTDKEPQGDDFVETDDYEQEGVEQDAADDQARGQ